MSMTQSDMLDQLQHRDDNYAPSVIGACGAGLFLAISGTGLRFLAHRLERRSTMAEDCFCVAALILFIAQSALYIVDAAQNGLGRHTAFLPDPIVFAKYSLALEMLIVTILSPAKIALLLLYRRIFPVPWFRLAVNLLIAFAVVLVVTCDVAVICQCIPVTALWESGVTAKCLNNVAVFAYGNAGGILLDFIMLSLPLPILLKLNMSAWKKVQIISIFLTGSFATIASIIRFVYVLDISVTDPAWSFGKVAVWSEMETCLAVLCASLPTYGPIVRVVKAKYLTYQSLRENPIQPQRIDVETPTPREKLEVAATKPKHLPPFNKLFK